MIIVTIPNNNIPERKYACKMIFENFLGLKYQLEIGNNQFTLISWADKFIKISDFLWNGKEDYDYLTTENLPKVRMIKTSFATESNLPVFYGTGGIELQANSITCDIDIFATIFFMLTRWEEIVVDKKDKHDRFIGKESIAYKNEILNRPIVNEYIEFLWHLMIYLGFNDHRKERKFDLFLSHDIDRPYMKFRFLRTTKHIITSIKCLDYKSVIAYAKDFFKDPYDTYSFFMDLSERVNIKSRFYFMSADFKINKYAKSPYIGNRFLRIVQRIRNRGHIIGFHPGYFSTDFESWKREKDDLVQVIGQSVTEGRQHFLRFTVPLTFEIWERNGMLIDSTLSYADVEGFRCGTGDEFPVFDVLKRREYALRERPLIVMDGTLVGYQKYTMQEISKILNYYICIGRKYNMPITILFHNSSFLGESGRQLKQIYQDMVNSVKTNATF